MRLLDYRPQFSGTAAGRWAENIFGINASASPLPSERDQNFLLQTADGQRFVLKIANALEDETMLEAQQQAISHLSRGSSLCPRPWPTLSGTDMARIPGTRDMTHLVRLFTYLPGIPMGNVRRHSPALLFDLGRRVGQVDRALETFDHPAFHRQFHWDLANGITVIKEHLGLIADPGLRAIVENLAASLEARVLPRLEKLRRSIIHNDANNFNVIAGGGSDLHSHNQQVQGLIDFGDMVYSYTIGDLAVAIAYAVLDKADPLAAAVPIVKGYQAEYPLKEEEIACLFDLVRLRLCLSVCLAAWQQQQEPGNEYLAISQSAIKATLPRLAAIHPRFAEAVFRRAAGLDPVPASTIVKNWIMAQAAGFSSILETDLKTGPCRVLDLGIESPLVGGDASGNEEPRLTVRIFAALEAAGVTVGIGRYDEPRLLYTSPLFAAGAGPLDEHRTIHLGIDLFAPAGTAVYAPLEGKIQAFSYNPQPLDYGAVIILEHRTGEGTPFYTLYGHLAAASLQGLEKGKPIGRGEKLAHFGQPTENGGWTPHVHFQLIVDLLDLDCDFPGVSCASEREIWCSLSPDPNLVLGIPAGRFPAEPVERDTTLSLRHRHLGRNLRLSYQEPLKIVRGWMQYLYDGDGRRYLDAYNNVPHVGHCHPRVIEAGQEQMARLNTNTRYLHDLINRYAEKLGDLLPGPLRVCYFLNSASEANELALRLARSFTGARDMIVLEAAYHGHTTSLIDISPYKHSGPGGSGAPAWVHTAPLPDGFRGLYKYGDPDAGEKYAGHVREIIADLNRRHVGLAGFIAESCPSVAGQIFFPPGYLAAVYEAVRKAGGLCIADDVQTGYGRIGTHFWGFATQAVVPDIVVLGKPIGNGHPLAAVITTPEIAAAFDNGMEFFSTFGGNTVSCAIGLAVLETVLEEKLMEHARQVGGQLLAGFSTLKEKYPLIGDVRGSGLFLGLELVRDRQTLQPATAEAEFIVNRLRQHGILAGTDGPFHNVIKVRPPMPFSGEDATLLLDALDTILAEDFIS